MQRPISIAVIGASQATTEEQALAEEVGRLIARRGAVLVCGGLTGVMEAACRGADAEGGLTVGILPGDSAATANRFVRVPIVTGMGSARNRMVVRSADTVVAIGGGYGTLSELAFAMQANVPIVGLKTWHISRDGDEDTTIIRADSAADAVEVALGLAEARKVGHGDA